jgi:hypothetical protein
VAKISDDGTNFLWPTFYSGSVGGLAQTLSFEVRDLPKACPALQGCRKSYHLLREIADARLRGVQGVQPAAARKPNEMGMVQVHVDRLPLLWTSLPGG